MNRDPAGEVSVKEYARQRLHELGNLTVSLVIDAAVLVSWTVVNWSCDHFVIEPMRLHGTDGLVLAVLRWAFGISTLVGALSYVVVDVVAIVARATRRVRAELRQVP